MMSLTAASEAGNPARPNEDFFISAPGFVAVLDGVSSPAGLDTGCVHDPAWYIQRLASRLVEAQTGEPSADLRELLARAITAVRADHGGRCDLSHPGSPQATVTILRAREDRCDYLVLSDCTIVLELGGAVTAVTDRRLENFATDLREHAFAGTAAIATHDQAERLRALALGKREHHNRPGGYWTAAADPQAAREAIVGNEPLTGAGRVTRAALLTDGVSCLVDTFVQLDWTALLDLIDTHGPGHVIDLVRGLEDSDPAGRDWPRSKHHDDATVAYVRFEMEATQR